MSSCWESFFFLSLPCIQGGACGWTAAAPAARARARNRHTEGVRAKSCAEFTSCARPQPLPFPPPEVSPPPPWEYGWRRTLPGSAAASRSSAERARCAAPGRSRLESYSTPSGAKRALGACARQTGSDEAGKRGGPRPVSHSGSGADAVSVLCLRSH